MAKLVTNDTDVCFLELLVPTYNRSRQLSRLLTLLEREMRRVDDDVAIRITVSDNHSTDSTAEMLRGHSFRGGIRLHVQPTNIGALRNIWSLYECSRAQYVWIHSDDDIPKEGALNTIVTALKEHEPTVLTFEFEQPLGTPLRRHGDGTGIEVLTDMRLAVPHLLVLGKLTKYVTRATLLPLALERVEHLRDTGYGWQTVILEVLELSQ